MATRPWQAAPILGVRNVRAAAEYYRDVLGFQLDPVNGVFEPVPNEPGGVYGIVTRQGAVIHFQIRRGDLPDRTRQALERDIYLYITDLDAVHADLQQRGANILHGPRMAPHGIREMVVEDLNHFRIAFGELG